MGLIENISSLVKLFSNKSTETRYKEDDDNYQVTFTSTVDVLKEQLTTSFVDYIKKFQSFLRLTFKHEDSNYPLDDFINYVFSDGRCELHLFVLKKKIKNLSFEYDIYFNISEFCSNIYKGKTNAFSSTDKMKVLFLPVKKTYKNNYTYIVPIEQFGSKNITQKVVPLIGHVNDQQRAIHKLFDKEVENPFRLFFKEEIECDKLYKALNYKLFINTMILLSNKYEDNQLFFFGERNLELSEHYFEVKNPGSILKILRFNLDFSKFNDKVAITRNVITIYLTEENKLKKIDDVIDQILETLDLHFSAYVKKQLDNFFDRRKEVIDEAYNAAKASSDQSDKVINSINVTIIGLLSAVLTGLLSYSTGSKSFLILALVAHLVYFILISTINIRNGYVRKNQINKQFDDYGNEFSILSPKEIEDIKTSFLSPSLKRLNNSIKLFIWISIILSLVVLAFLIYIIVCYNPDIDTLLK